VDPLTTVWSEMQRELERAPELQANALLALLQERYPGRYGNELLRTMQRRVKCWRALAGPDKEVFFAQVHEPGRLASSDFTHLTNLGVTIAGQPFPHLAYHFVLTYSNWELVRAGQRVLFTKCNALVQTLLLAKRDLTLKTVLRRLANWDVLIIDDLGYVQQSREEMEVLFTLLAERYELGSVMVTSNLAFSQWEQIFKDPMTTAAAIDRLVHHCTIVELNVSSYRMETAKRARQGQT
jgi:hypothetical protein